MDAGRNLLSGETSPYLLQQARNPVHWRPWGAAALASTMADIDSRRFKAMLRARSQRSESSNR